MNQDDGSDLIDSGQSLAEAPYVDLASVRRDAFARLRRGARDRRSPFHTPVLVTIGLDGSPAARTVVLRGFEPAARVVVVHTDLRSRKIAEVTANPRVALIFYDGKSGIQVRIDAKASVHAGDEVARKAWEKLPAFSRRCYLGLPPGSNSPEPSSGLPTELELRAPYPAESEHGFANFALIISRLIRLDWLYLSARGHRRAQYRWNDAGEEVAGWLNP
jgi:hypothetical protein